MFRRSPQPCPAHPVLIKQPMHINVNDALLQNGLCGLKKKNKRLVKDYFLEIWTHPHRTPFLKIQEILLRIMVIFLLFA